MMFQNLKFFCISLLALPHVVPSFVSPFQAVERGISYASIPLPPSQDPWYTAPKNFEATPPGTILRLRSAPGNLSTITSNCSSAYNILYRTTDSRYQPSWAVTTLYIPTQLSNSTSDLGKSLLSYQFPYNSVDVDSSPSYSFYSGVLSDVTLALGNGWFVSVPDFEGPNASNVAGILEAHSTLDSLRAIISAHQKFALSPNVTVALWGYSGGSIPSEWALEFQEQYAPELHISGAALGGLVPNVTTVIDSVGGTIWASHAISGILGILSQYPDAYAYLLSRLKTSGPYNSTSFLAIQRMSYPQAHEFYANQSLFDYFPQGAAILQHPLIKTALQKNAVMTYHGVPNTPVFVYKAVNDEVTLVGDSDAYVERSCAMGAKVRYERNLVGGHVDEFTNGQGRALAWLNDIFEGRVVESECTVVNITVAIVDSGL
ncbi:secretory lipase-domain-containing protein [Tricladium varicosporioides]|nr:secretory lipase-domain-containing protein [Hymenoscyphus varicosporioides]